MYHDYKNMRIFEGTSGNIDKSLKDINAKRRKAGRKPMTKMDFLDLAVKSLDKAVAVQA